MYIAWNKFLVRYLLNKNQPKLWSKESCEHFMKNETAKNAFQLAFTFPVINNAL